MSQFLSGAAVDCGPSSVLKNVGGRIDRDFSLQQDRLVSTPNTAGPSNHAFRPTAPRVASRPSVPQAQSTPAPFDLSSLRQHLSPPPAPLQSVSRAPIQAGGWADSFIPAETSRAASSAGQRAQSPHHAGPSPWQADFRNHVDSARSSPAPPSLRQANTAPWQRPVHLPQYTPSPYQHYQPPHFVPESAYHPPPPLHPSYSSQPNHPVQVGRPTSALQETPREEVQGREPLSQPQDLLARTAESLVNGVVADEHLAQNPKLAESKFMALMQAVAKGKVVVDEGEPSVSEEVGEGARFVARSAGGTGWTGDFLGQPSAATSSQASRTHEPALPQVFDRAGPSTWTTQFGDQEALVMSDSRPATQRRKSVHFDPVSEPASLGSGVPANLDEALHHTTAVPGASESWEEQGLDDDEFGEEAFMNFNGPMRVAREGRIGVGALEGWGELQNDWEAFSRAEPGQHGLRGQETGDRVERYLFQRANPYAQSGVREDEMTGRESPTLKGVLELEAAVQDDPTDHEAWYALGLKQQENERDDAAILALSKVVQLAPEYRHAYLALAVSYTNEGAREAANTMLETWLDLGDGVSADEALTRREALSSGASAFGWQEGQRRLVERLIDVARRNPEDVDADTQVALGVLFNSSEEYEKAEDCFLAALSARPDDWLLYNRLGATLANSGRSNEAIDYYHKALSLHPNFVRALFNLGISYINLAQYPLAAQRVLDALRLQHADATEGYATGKAGGVKGVMSDTLWTTLRNACLHMGRGDLVELASRKDITGFPLDLAGVTQASA